MVEAALAEEAVASAVSVVVVSAAAVQEVAGDLKNNGITAFTIALFLQHPEQLKYQRKDHGQQAEQDQYPGHILAAVLRQAKRM